MVSESFVNSLPEHWELTTLGEACKRGGGDIQTGPFGSQLHASDYVPTGIPSIMPQNIGDNRIIIDGIARITVEDAERLSRYRVREGDIVYSRRGDVERRALIREEENGWLCGTGCLRVRFGSSAIDPLFASYYLGHPEVRQWIVRHAVGATMPNLNTSILSALPFVIPSLDEQQAIAQVLGSLDEKIQLNRQIDETLEETARAVFESWFVEYSPVRAFLGESASEGIDEDIAALFPDSFDDSEVGEVPKGWKVGKLQELISERSERIGKTEDAVVFSAVQTGNLIRSEEQFNKKVFSNDISKYKLVERTNYAYNPSRINIGSIGMLEEGVLGAVSPVYTVFKVKVGYEWWLRFFIRLPRTREIISQLCSGSVRQSLTFRDLASVPVVIPPPMVVEAFTQHYLLLRDVQINLREQNQSLAAIRDTLLPKLMSGEISVKP